MKALTNPTLMSFFYMISGFWIATFVAHIYNETGIGYVVMSAVLAFLFAGIAEFFLIRVKKEVRNNGQDHV